MMLCVGWGRIPRKGFCFSLFCCIHHEKGWICVFSANLCYFIFFSNAGTTYFSRMTIVDARLDKSAKLSTLTAFFARSQFLLELFCLVKSSRTQRSLLHHMFALYVNSLSIFSRSELSFCITYNLCCLPGNNPSYYVVFLLQSEAPIRRESREYVFA